ncbi:hypothetical protein [Zongyangia hominis]|uniref:Uncharacterized protein n=1 Tax=Zongyangia hominis TaxID=2763677 RepID=A0A926EBI0_9FIRM|nr:hypothetical protein [Zongyangia hominis]MBC8569314.1 hypothetical protein [Zongyangia hominis]
MTLFEFIEEIVNRLRDSEKNHYGFLWKNGGLQLSDPGAIVEFVPGGPCSPDFRLEDGSLVLTACGTYRACFLLYPPATAEAQTVAALYLDDAPLAGSRVKIEKEPGGTAPCICGQCIFPVHSPAKLSLRLDAPVHWQADPNELIATLEVIRITSLPDADTQN